jgi:hypothetical protein
VTCGAGAGEADPEFELRYLDADGAERRELPAACPGLRPETFMPVWDAPLADAAVYAPAQGIGVGPGGAARSRRPSRSPVRSAPPSPVPALVHAPLPRVVGRHA